MYIDVCPFEVVLVGAQNGGQLTGSSSALASPEGLTVIPLTVLEQEKAKSGLAVSWFSIMSALTGSQALTLLVTDITVTVTLWAPLNTKLLRLL